MSRKLYEIAGDLRQLLEASIDENGVIDDAALVAFANLEGQLDAKAEAVALYILEIEADASATEKEAKRLRERQQSIERRGASLRTYLERYLEGREVKGRLVSIGYRKSETVEVDEARLPVEWWRVSREPDKTSIKTALKVGTVVPGARLVPHQRMQIR